MPDSTSYILFEPVVSSSLNKIALLNAIPSREATVSAHSASGTKAGVTDLFAGAQSLLAADTVLFRHSLIILDSLGSANHALPPICFHLSLASISEPAVLDELLDHCRIRGFETSQILLAISGQEIERFENLEITLHTIKKEGFGVVVDNFVASDKSLDALASPLIDYVRIDAMDVASRTSGSFQRGYLRALIFIAEHFDKQIIVKAVDSTTTFNEMSNLGITLFQGPHFSHPLASGSLSDYLSNFRGSI